MNYKKRFEDEGFVYELSVLESTIIPEDLVNYPQVGLWCKWDIINKREQYKSELPVTNDDCKVIVYTSFQDAVIGARKFLSI